jgi:Na+/proline symporter/Fe-S-cluster containining protein
MSRSKKARVNNSAEFSSSTVATSISFATVIMAFFALAQWFGLWLLWTVVTTVLGLFLVRFFAERIWHRVADYAHRPTLHEFLGGQFNSKAISQVGAICTSLGFLGAFATELTVGSRFFAGLIPAIPPWTIVILLSTVAFIYTAFGGFRAVIVTDRVQMFSIWLLLVSLPVFYIYYVFTHGGWTVNYNNIPAGVMDFSIAGRIGLVAFLLGIMAMNVPSFLSDMSVWQRIAGAQDSKTVTKGLFRGLFSASITWTALVMLACFVFMIVKPVDGLNPLISLVQVIGNTGGWFGIVIMFVTVFGLYGAMLSTASTQLIAVSHTLYVDVFSRFVKPGPHGEIESRTELNVSRIILVVAAIVSTVLVQLLTAAGFSVADLVFAIYGAQLGLCPLVILALVMDKQKLKSLSIWAVTAVSTGFIAGWGSAIYGNLTGMGNLIFLSPVCSLAASSIVLAIGMIAINRSKALSKNVNWILITSVIKARAAGLYRIVPADKPIRLDCLMDKCSVCCNSIGTPVITDAEAKTIGPDSIMTDKDASFVKSTGCICKFLAQGLCSIHTTRPKACREYPWYNIGGKLYYDSGCPGVKFDKDERPDVNEIQPFENFFPNTPKLIIWLIKKICVRNR